MDYLWIIPVKFRENLPCGLGGDFVKRNWESPTTDINDITKAQL
jgi:hypothetical protein